VTAMPTYTQPAPAAAVSPHLSDAEVAALVESYLPLVASTVDRIWLSPRLALTRDDLISAGSYGLLLAARRFDPARGVGFGIFARAHVHGAVMREIRKVARAGFATADDLLAPEGGPVSPESLPDEQSDAALLGAEAAEVRNLIECFLTPDERTLLSLYFYEELTIDEIAAVLGCSPRAAARAVKRVLGKLKAALAERREA